MTKHLHIVGVNESYEELYGAIFQQAVKDDVRHICCLIKEELAGRCYNPLMIKLFIKKHLTEMRVVIQRYIHQETVDWSPWTTVAVRNTKLNNLYRHVLNYL